MRYPWEPLERYFGTDGDAASLLGVTVRSVQRFKRRGLSLNQAERVADALGEHPFVIWPEMRDELVASVETSCEADDCSERFTTSPYGRGGRGKRFCSETCRARMKNRRRRQSEEVRRQDRERQRAYDAYLRERRLERDPGRRLQLLARLEVEQVPVVDRHLRDRKAS